MPIAIQPSKDSRIGAYAAGHPTATRNEIARTLKLLTSDVNEVLGREPKRRAKTVAK